jgi:hypothetical protein
MECIKIWIWNIIKLKSMMKISNPRKKQIAWIFETNIENILKLKRITKFNMIMIINCFFTEIVIDYNSIKYLIHYICIFTLNDLIICSFFETKKI